MEDNIVMDKNRICVWCGKPKVEAHWSAWDGPDYCKCGCEGEKEEKRLKEEIAEAEKQLKDLKLKLKEHYKTSVYYKELSGLYEKMDEINKMIERTNDVKYDIESSCELYRMTNKI